MPLSPRTSPVLPIDAIESPVIEVMATAAANDTLPPPPPPLSALASNSVSFCSLLVLLAVPSSVAPPCVALAKVSTVRSLLAITLTVAPRRRAAPSIAAWVSPERIVSASVPPTALLLDPPAVPSALVMMSTVFCAFTSATPPAVRLAVPATVVVALLLIIAVAMVASADELLLEPSGAVLALARTLDVAESSRSADAVMTDAALTSTPAVDVPWIATTFTAPPNRSAALLSMSIFDSTTRPMSSPVRVAPLTVICPPALASRSVPRMPAFATELTAR